ncbi:hypothetical protein [Falsiroseomonas sp. CW058]|uniref:hypothetical protein n=1 Tax=Falsiroseomonas sp. CW058 TaxID=3388664 RepID=UPI003D31B36D
MARLLWTTGVLLVTLGLAARAFGWDALLWLPEAAMRAVEADPATYGLVALGLVLMVLAWLIRRWRGQG